MALPTALPAGAMVLVPSNYIAAPAGGFVAPQPGSSVQQQAALVPPAAAARSGEATARGSFDGSSGERPQPQTVSCIQEADGSFRVKWTVDARKLKGNDKTVVSPPFEMSSKAIGTFKMMINPTASKLKGGATFRNSNGRGSVQLKCDTASESKLAIRFSIGDV